MRIRWTPQTKQDLSEIRAYIARDSRVYATRTIRRIKSAVDVLRRWPESGSLVPEDQTQQVREVIVGNYRAIYEIFGNEIRILTVIHAARNLSADMLPPQSPPEP